MKKLCVKCQVIVVILCLSQSLFAQKLPLPKVMATPSPGSGAVPNPPNGISVDRPKVFDNRTLTLMLESLSESLRKVQFIDQQTLAAALQLIQGFETREVVSNLSIGTRPTPKLTQSTTTKTGNATDSGVLLPDSTENKTESERAAENPQPPALSTLPEFSGFTPNYGENASDLLNDQVNLTYRIFNLRMLLERSLTDRLLSGENPKPRRQAVLGFNVTVDPPRTAEDAVAVVEITLKLPSETTNDPATKKNNSACKKQDGLSLVSMMPEEKTYNAAALSTNSHAFGGAAMVKMINVGYNERRLGRTFYLYRDADTIAYQRMNEGKPDEVTFGWMFRPVLGQRSVTPGLRQLFAIVALPEGDNEQDNNCKYLNASVQTYWKKYDRATRTSFKAEDANRFTRFRYAMSLNLSKPEIFEERYINTACYNDVEILPTHEYQKSLRPTVSSVTWRPTGGKAVIISATGENFFSETKVAIGDKIYSTTADGLILKSNQSFDLTTTIDALANGNGMIIGRYGTSVPLIRSEDLEIPGKLAIKGLVVSLPNSGNRSLYITLSDQSDLLAPASLRANLTLLNDLKNKKNKQNETASLRENENLLDAPIPIITVNGKPVPLPYEFADGPEGSHLKYIQCHVPESFFTNGGGVLKISYPFLPGNWTATSFIANPDADLEVTRLSKSSILLSSHNALGFTRNPDGEKPKNPVCWEMLSGIKRYILNNKPDDGSPACTNGNSEIQGLSTHSIWIVLKDKDQDVEIPDKITLISPWGAVTTLDVPKSPAPEPVAPKPLTVGVQDRVYIEIPIDDPAAVSRIEAAQQSLEFFIPEPEKENVPVKKIKVQITDKITAKPGNVDLSIFDAKGKRLKIVTLQVVCKTCRNKGEK